LKTWFDFMIRYSAYGGTNYRMNPSALTNLPCSLATEYRELKDLRERVRKAEAAAAKHLGPRGRGHQKTMTDRSKECPSELASASVRENGRAHYCFAMRRPRCWSCSISINSRSRLSRRVVRN
jgi:hypothetical protein